MMSGIGICILTLGLLSSVAQSLRFDLQSGHTKCISEDIKSNAMTIGKYSVINSNEGHPLPDSHKITLRVTSSYGNNYHFGDLVESGQFAFTAAESGDYLACFSVLDHNPPVTVTVDFDWRTGVTTTNWSNVAKKGQIDDMEIELKKLVSSITSIHEEMFYLRDRAFYISKEIGVYTQVFWDLWLVAAGALLIQQDTVGLDRGYVSQNAHVVEEEMQELNKATNSRMAWLSFLSLLVCLSVAGLQLWHLKTFFERKKLL